MIKKLLKALAVLLLLILVAMFLFPIIYKDEIVGKAKSTINEQVNANVSFGDFNLSFFRSFPNLSFGVENLVVHGVDTFQKDTLCQINDFNMVVDLMSVIEGNQIIVRNIEIDQAKFLIKVLKNGTANYDIAKVDSSTTDSNNTESSAFQLALKKYSIQNSNLIYDDASLEVNVIMHNFDHQGSGDFTQDLFSLMTSTKVEQFSFIYAAVPYLNKVKLEAEAPIEMDMLKSKYTFNKNEFKLNDLIIGFDGYVSMPDTNIDIDLRFNAEKSEFKNFLSMIPAIYSNSYSSLTAAGNFAMNGYYKGRMNAVEMPGFGLNIEIENGNFKYPDLPSAVNNVQMNLLIDNPDGIIDHTVVDLKKLHLEFGKEPFDLNFKLKTPESDPDLQAELKGKIDLANILQIIPLEDTKLKGIIKTDMRARGKLSTIEKGNYESFDAAGFLNISKFEYSSGTDMPIAISQVNFDFSPRYVQMNDLKASYGKSNFQASGRLENYIAYALNDGTIKAKLNFNADMIDLNAFSSSSQESTTNTDTAEVLAIPSNIDFTMESSIDKILYDNMVIENLKGQLSIQKSILNFKEVSLQTLDALVQLNGDYNSQNIAKPSMNMSFGIKGMDIQKAFSTFNTVKKLAPLAEKTQGKFNGNVNFKSQLDQHMEPLYPSVQGSGQLEILDAKIVGSNILQSLGEKLKTEKLKELAIQNTKILFSIVDGRVIVKPFDMKAAAVNMNIAGSSGLDQSIDYAMKITLPKSYLGASANQILNQLGSTLNANGANLAPNTELKINALVGGSVSKPELKLNMAESGANIKAAITDVANAKKEEAIKKGKEEARKKAEQILSAAQQQSDLIKKQARDLADKTKAEGYAQADRLVKEANNPVAKEAAKIAAAKLKKETDAKAAKIISEGDRKADEVMAKARAEADKLLR